MFSVSGGCRAALVLAAALMQSCGDSGNGASPDRRDAGEIDARGGGGSTGGSSDAAGSGGRAADQGGRPDARVDAAAPGSPDGGSDAAGPSGPDVGLDAARPPTPDLGSSDGAAPPVPDAKPADGSTPPVRDALPADAASPPVRDALPADGASPPVRDAVPPDAAAPPVPDAGPPCLPAAEICDGIDNDCDGDADEPSQELCALGSACRAGACVPNTPPGFVRIEPGVFQMGSPADEPGHRADETQHEVRITRPFDIAATEVTRRSWWAVMGFSYSIFDHCGENCPAHFIGWTDAVLYVNRLSVREGLPVCYRIRGNGPITTRFPPIEVDFVGLDCPGYRLPTEAEWEYAARAGTQTPFSSGLAAGGAFAFGCDPVNPQLDPVGWYCGNVFVGGRQTLSEPGVVLRDVALKAPNAWGLYDVHGNVREYVHDLLGEYPAGRVVDPLGPPSRRCAPGEYGCNGGRRLPIARGGSYFSLAEHARSAMRTAEFPDDRDWMYGLRPVRGGNAPVCVPRDEICNGSDDDCDGQVDEAAGELCPAGNACMDGACRAVAPPAGFVRIEPGVFTIGSPPGEPGRAEAWWSEDQQVVTITRPFAMQATEVTQGQWQAVMGTRPSGFAACGDDCPVESITWEEAVDYVNRLSDREGLPLCYTATRELVHPGCAGYRLPTEAEWEYAARAGTASAFPTGALSVAGAECAPLDPNLDPIGWYCGNADGRTHPVAEKRPNAWGLYDMHGNVMEYVQDTESEYGAFPVFDPVGGFGEPYEAIIGRGMRGGSWFTPAAIARSAQRLFGPSDSRSDFAGFRPVRTLPGAIDPWTLRPVP